MVYDINNAHDLPPCSGNSYPGEMMNSGILQIPRSFFFFLLGKRWHDAEDRGGFCSPWFSNVKSHADDQLW